jgi:hypothetical protein
MSSTGSQGLLGNDGIGYWTHEGTTSGTGTGELKLGNNIASGTAGNKRGMIYMYGTSSGYTEIIPTNNTTSNIQINLPSSGGTLALTTSNITGNAATATKATQDGNGATISSTYLKRSGGVMTGLLEMKPNGSSVEGGEIHLCASTSANAVNGIILDNYNGTFRIFGVPSADGSTKTGNGIPLVIDPYAKTITGNYTIQVGAVYGAVWNDYAEYRETTTEIEPGRVVIENGNDTLSLCQERLMATAQVVSDTFGFAIGETDNCKTPLAVSGRVLVYTDMPRETF